MKKLLYILIALSVVSCKKDAATDENIPARNVELHDQTFGLFILSYDVLSSIDSNFQSALYIDNKGLYIEWIDSLFSDGDGIEALIHIKNLDTLTNKFIYGRDGKQRNGMLKLIAEKPFSDPQTQGKIEILESYNFKTGYNASKMFSVIGKLDYSKSLTQEWSLSSSSLSFEKGNYEISLNKKIVFKNKMQGVWNNKATITGSSSGKIVHEFTSEISEPLEIFFNNKCSALYKRGKKNISIGKDKWIADFDGFNSEECDRLVKLSIGRKEFYKEMY